MLDPAIAEEESMSGRRLIGIDLAWGKETGTDYESTDCEGSGCAELVRDGDDLTLKRLDLLHSMDEIVKWIEPKRGDWVVAVDAPLVIHNWGGRRRAEEQACDVYHPYDAHPYSTNLETRGEHHRGGQLLRALEAHCGVLVEDPAKRAAGRLIFETYPHPATVELFDIDRIIKYKNCVKDQMILGQKQLACAIRRYLCPDGAKPRLRCSDDLDSLLEVPETILKSGLKNREDVIDGLICAYIAAWVDAGRPSRGFGDVGDSVMIVPNVRDLKPGQKPKLRPWRIPKRLEHTKQRKSRGTSAAASSKSSDEPLCWQPEGPRTCCCGCGKPTTNCFSQGHDGKVTGWLTDVQKGKKDISELPDAVRRINLRRFHGGKFKALDLRTVPPA